MLERLIEFSLRRRWLVILVAGLVALAGVVSFMHLPIDAFPDTTPVQVQVNTSVSALSPLEIEQQVTYPIEQAIGGLPGLQEVRSMSKFGLSQVTALFEDGVDLYFARYLISERIASLELAEGIPKPTLGPVATGLGEIYHYRLVGEGKSLQELRTIHDWTVRPRLRSVAGVAEVNAWGGEERQIQVVIDPDRLVKFGLTFEDLFTALRENNRNVGGGVIETGEAQIVQGVGVLTSPADVGGVVVAARNGSPVRVRDVAKIVDGHAIRGGAVTAEGEGETVLGLAFMLMGENSHEVAGRIRDRVEEIQAGLPAGVKIVPLYDRTHLVEEVLETVRENLFEGALLVIAVLFAFLGSVRAGLIVAAAIPLSMLFAGSLMARVGIAGSLMSLGAIDFGLVVDSSVILVENAARRLSEDRGRRTVLEVVRDAAVEVRRPTLFGELIILIVYLPILTLEGIEGKMFRPMVLTVVFALVGSMILSLTLMPALASLVLRRGSGGERETWLVRALKRGYRPILEWSLGHRRMVLGGAMLTVLGAGVLGSRLGSEFIPRLSEGSIVINCVRATGVTLSESVRLSTRIEGLLKERFPAEIEAIWSRTGNAEVATDPMGIELTDVFITLKHRKDWTRARTQDDLVGQIEAELIDLPGMRTVYMQPIEMRINEMVAGIRSDVGVKIFGDDLELLKEKAAEIAEVLEGVEGASDVVVEQVTGQPILEVRPDPERLGRHGIAGERVLEVVETIGGLEVGEMREGEMRFPIAVWLGEPFRSDPASLGRVAIGTPNGGSVPLGSLADVRRYDGPSTITREWGKRRIVVQANARGRDVGSFVEEAQRRVAGVELPAGSYVQWGGQWEHLLRARNRLAIVVPIALILILCLLYATYGRWRDALRVFTGVPFAVVGGVLALVLRGMPFSVSAGVGFVALSGVAVLGDMVLVSHIRQQLARDMELREAVRSAAITRLRPVLMTGLVASLGFLPMALNTGIGAEVQRPLATVVVGGVLSSMVLTLVVLPVLYTVLSKPARAIPREENH